MRPLILRCFCGFLPYKMKMWGNGVALPCVVFVLSGIVYYTQLEC